MECFPLTDLPFSSDSPGYDTNCEIEDDDFYQNMSNSLPVTQKSSTCPSRTEPTLQPQLIELPLLVLSAYITQVTRKCNVVALFTVTRTCQLIQSLIHCIVYSLP